MIRRRKTRGLMDSRAALRGSGDVAVGAFAHQQRRRHILMGLFGVVLIGGAVWLYTLFSPNEGVNPTGTYSIAAECVKCGWRGVLRVEAGNEAFPLTCPQCGERACHKLWECRTCGHQFLHKGGGPLLQCPKCRGRNVGTAKTPAKRPEEE